MKTKRFFSILLALCLICGMAFAAGAAACAADTITVYISFEGYNLGQGFYVELTALTLPAGSSVDDATAALFARDGIEAEYDAVWGYLTAVKDFDTGVVNIPAYITAQPGFAQHSAANDDDWLGELDYTYESGWMYTLNHASGNGAAFDILGGGDVIRWQFSVWGWGNDLGVEDDWGYAEPFYEHCDKTALIRLLFTEGAGDADIQAALDVVIDPLATDAGIAAAAAPFLLLAAKAAKIAAINAADSGLAAKDYTAESWAALQVAIAQALNAVLAAETVAAVNAVAVPVTADLEKAPVPDSPLLPGWAWGLIGGGAGALLAGIIGTIGGFIAGGLIPGFAGSIIGFFGGGLVTAAVSVVIGLIGGGIAFLIGWLLP